MSQSPFGKIPGGSRLNSVIKSIKMNIMRSGSKRLRNRGVGLVVVLLLAALVGAAVGIPAPAAGAADPVRHWAFIPPVRPALPVVKDASWSRTPIDRFILATLEREGLAPSNAAAKTTLIRRLSLDLTGLPPDDRRDRCVPAGSLAGCLREAGRAAAGLASLRGAMGALVARRGALRRHQRV